ncbi:MAG: four-carbon acid sugar kinase family protein [Spirochaetales bacterium]
MSIFVITDDLTGANDTAVQFAKQGLRTLVYLETPKDSLSVEPAPVQVFNTDSRALPAEEAKQRIRNMLRMLPLSSTDLLYKKIDSTLRGNIGVEVTEALKYSNRELAFVAPAYPKYRRTTQEGVHYVNGTPVADTEAARDPRCPVLSSHISDLFRFPGSLPVQGIPLRVLRLGSPALKNQIETLKKEGKRIFIFDAETEDDLSILANTGLIKEFSILWVGSAGLAEALSTVYLAKETFTPFRPSSLTSPTSNPKPVLVLLGSMSEVATKQAEAFLSVSQAQSFILLPEQLASNPKITVYELVKNLEKSLSRGLHTLLMSDRRKWKPSSPNELDPISLILDAFRQVGETLNFSLCSGLIVTGGDIATAVCRGMGVRSIEVHRETSPGIPLGLIQGGKWEGLPLVTKAGAFGAPDAIIQAARTLCITPL